MARLLNIIILGAFIIFVNGEWRRTPECLFKEWKKKLEPLLQEYYKPKSITDIRFNAIFEFRFPDDNEFAVWLKFKIDGVPQFAVIQGFVYNTGELRIYTVDLYPYYFGSSGRWQRIQNDKFKSLKTEFKPLLSEYYAPENTDIVEIYFAWDLVDSDNGQTEIWTKIKVGGVFYLAEMKAFRDETGKITVIFVNRYPFKRYRCPKKSC
ncbi:uncharacterized protein LOC129573199 [Sitodiplosis mosellana]|uniref:uncharacterized protein LOC129573199 n=1 Tax=Sitodiplosis mosellana TaxID=263140 RepID=UPI002444C337|nr:uncharacterized protein LOC129573199 [Sitodiplosis mosellana]